jgi:hypothetical protein
MLASRLLPPLVVVTLALAPGGAAGDAVDPIRFELHPAPGLDFVTDPSRTERRHQPETMVAGVAVFDYNNDGLLDVYAVNGARMTSLDKSEPRFWNRLYRNLGNLHFEDVTEEAGVKGVGYDQGIAVADYDDDGFVDLFVAGVRRNTLFRNNGDGTFSDVTEKAGLLEPDPDYGTLWAVAAAFLDYDKDDRLDLFVSNYCVWDPRTEPHCGPMAHAEYCHPKVYHGLPNSLFRGNPDGTFTDVSRTTGIRDHIGKGMGIGLADFDADSFLDLFVANDTLPNFLFRNDAGRRFEEIGLLAGVALTGYGKPLSGMGADAKDVDNDGRPDVFHTALSGETMPLFRNDGDNVFTEITSRSGLAALIISRAGWSNGIVDFNNDGRKDLFVAAGDVMDIEGMFRAQVLQANAIFVNQGNGRFTDATPAAGEEFSTKKAAHRGAAFGDLDNDGRVDAVVTDLHGPIEVWRNVSPTRNHWLLLDLVGRKGPRDATGARLRLTTSTGVQYGHVNTAVGYASASDRRVHFGLGASMEVEELEIVWPSGSVQTLRDVPADQILRLEEPE